MSSKTLLALNGAVLIGAYILYSVGYRIMLDDGPSGIPNVVAANESSASKSSWWGGSGSAHNYTCENLRMQPKFLSFDPIMVYIENFLSPYEARYLKKLAVPHYVQSVVESFDKDKGDDVYARVDESRRKSQTAWLKDGDPVVDCVKNRAAEIQGFSPTVIMEELAVIKYKEGGEFRMHYDWHHEKFQEIDRRTSFFAIVEASPNIKGGSTYFPTVEVPAWGSRDPWCKFIDCSYETGIAVRPVVGNAVFWVNFREDGSGHRDTVHSGEPIIEGTKIGLNIWTQARVRLI